MSSLAYNFAWLPEPSAITSLSFSFIICKMGTIMPASQVAWGLRDAWQTVGFSVLIHPDLQGFGNHLLSQVTGELWNRQMPRRVGSGCLQCVMYSVWIRHSLPDLCREAWASSQGVLWQLRKCGYLSICTCWRCSPVGREYVGNFSLTHSSVLRQTLPERLSRAY